MILDSEKRRRLLGYLCQPQLSFCAPLRSNGLGVIGVLGEAFSFLKRKRRRILDLRLPLALGKRHEATRSGPLSS